MIRGRARAESTIIKGKMMKAAVLSIFRYALSNLSGSSCILLITGKVTEEIAPEILLEGNAA